MCYGNLFFTTRVTLLHIHGASSHVELHHGKKCLIKYSFGHNYLYLIGWFALQIQI
jgi:hypothetical protein